MQISKEVIERYTDTRQDSDCGLVCHAPTVNLNFEQNGNVRACCYNTTHILGRWPEQRIREIWNGAQLAELRGHIGNNNLGGGCMECGKMLDSGNFHGVRARYYDEFAPDSFKERLKKTWGGLTGARPYPKVMEFELSNRCNLECVMCNGYFSSSIRKNREMLPALTSPYDERFVDELEEFLPHLTDAKFLGGEPFMIDIYLKIWERIRKVNPDIRIHITTNGTMLTDRVKKLLEGLRAGIILSIDSVNRETYSKIRINGDFDRVMANLDYLRDYTKRKGTFISMAACPITLNWHELPDMLRFCTERDIYLYFNAVFSPAELSLRELPANELAEVIDFLKAQPLPAKQEHGRSAQAMSLKAFMDFIHLLEGWLEEKDHTADNAQSTYSKVNVDFVRQPITDWELTEVSSLIMRYHTQTSADYVDKETELLNRLSNLMMDTPEGRLHEVLLCYFDLLEQDADRQAWLEKAMFIEGIIAHHPLRETILCEMGLSQPITLAQALTSMDEQMLTAALEQNFGKGH
jgi:MoaA/NifB/PqqE/SkfB family radical SAM enzyme